ncbi:hypothetical protein GCM10010983_49160 [Caulobacter rhizosphaerae]|jgi:hypothetical protein|nr:hypothetical protein GCM10010983_49160 [Caulobacter rhizosphaerae]
MALAAAAHPRYEDFSYLWSSSRMTTDPALAAFLALDDQAVAAYADARAEALGLALPPETRAGVVDNLALLRRQAATFVAAVGLDDTVPLEPFEP